MFTMPHVWVLKHWIDLSDTVQNGLVAPPAKAMEALHRLRWAEALAALLVVVALAGCLLWRRHPWGRRLAGLAGLSMLCALGGMMALSWSLAQGLGPERLALMTAMQARPDDPWPRGAGHVPLGTFNSSAEAKAYVETGGSLSPWFKSFGLSVWMRDAQGKLQTSDSLPEPQVHHRYQASPNGELALLTETPAYTATLEIDSDAGRTWRVVPAPGRPMALVVRGVGPAGGPLTHIQRQGDSLLLNGRWILRWHLPAGAALDRLCLGTESSAGWTQPCAVESATASASVQDANGWGQAQLWLRAATPITVDIVDTWRAPRRSEQLTAAPLRVSGISADFAASIEAQQHTLRQGVIQGEMRPGDPINYPLEWLRDNVYQLVALARSGDLALAEQLAQRIAARDFFGGFGAEGDNPGLALWGLNEVGKLLQQPAFDQRHLTDVRRKVAWLDAMRKGPVQLPDRYAGLRVPEHQGRSDFEQIAQAPRDGLIHGRMDLHIPRFYATALSHAGYLAAAEWFDRLGLGPEAQACRAHAQALQAAWNLAFSKRLQDVDNERNAIVSVWPGQIADTKLFRPWLDARWQHIIGPNGQFKTRPLWSYFTVAEAHQWLALNEPQRVWQTLDVLWRNQTMPGLYTLWEGRGEENSFRQWREARGWVNPTYVTPHHWSAAELLLLQQGMLADAEPAPDGTGYTLTIGRGLTSVHTREPISVANLGTELGMVSWQWDGLTLRVTGPAGFSGPVKASAAFPPGARIVIEHQPDH